jgi:hypothetical protein
MTKYYSDKNKFVTGKPVDTPISIPAERYDDSILRREYSCEYCHRTLNKLIDSSHQNPSWYCSSCNIKVIPSEEAELRARSRLKVPSGPIQEAAVAYAPEKGLKRKKNEPKGTFRRMQERGIKITNYSERNWRKEKEPND